MLTFLLVSLLALSEGVSCIGEGVLDVNTLTGLFRGFGDIFSDINTTAVNVTRMYGKWHQMYKASINFDVFSSQFYCPVSYFKPNPVMGPGGFSIEEGFHVVSKNGPIEVYKRDVTRAAPGKYWVNTEEYFYPHQFYIIKVGPSLKKRYQYIIATDQNRLSLYVMARNPTKFIAKYDQKVMEFLRKEGFGGESFWNTPVAIYHSETECYYPTEKELFARRILKDSLAKHSQQQQNALANSPSDPLTANSVASAKNLNGVLGRLAPIGEARRRTAHS